MSLEPLLLPPPPQLAMAMIPIKRVSGKNKNAFAWLGKSHTFIRGAMLPFFKSQLQFGLDASAGRPTREQRGERLELEWKIPGHTAW